MLDLLVMSESNKSNIIINSNPILNDALEKQGMQQVSDEITRNANLNKTPLEMQTLVLNIMKEGEKEFVKENKRCMTYLEMRRLYG
jgi:hypothetical protein